MKVYLPRYSTYLGFDGVVRKWLLFTNVDNPKYLPYKLCLIMSLASNLYRAPS